MLRKTETVYNDEKIMKGTLPVPENGFWFENVENAMRSFFDPLPDNVAVYLWWLMALAVLTVAAKRIHKRRFLCQVMANLQAQCQLDEDYHVFRSLDICCRGRHEQIDYVYLSRYGIFVVSAPKQQGKIWGDDGSGFWVRRLHHAQTRFPNPLVKNQQYIHALAEKLGLSPRIFHSVVVFAKHCRFQTVMPDNVVDSGDFTGFVRQYDEVVLSDEEVRQIKAVLETSEFDTVFGTTRRLSVQGY